ncbi:hypothetical protein [Oenococcus sicerae]|uniref:hypothetical protein n=1 Tax=Oenococcus sicerae TaxID=2203724 RepID=UPI0010B4DBEC|nr:hypothetical protein OAL24_00004 [Oenococcus sicerae]
MLAVKSYTKEYIDRSEGQTHLLLDDIQANDQIFLQSVLLALNDRFSNRMHTMENNITSSFNALTELRLVAEAIKSGKPIVFPKHFQYESIFSFQNGNSIKLTREKLLAFIELFFKQIRQIFQLN